MTVKPGSKIYFMGIGGTGMAAVAGLCQEAGYQVSGSDVAMYPPMSTMLDELKIPVLTPYNADNVAQASPDLVVVANALSRGHVELEALLRSGTAYTSFPKLTGDIFLVHRTSVVVTGTHGKTTTASLLAHMLFELGEDPGFIIGGIPRNFPRSFRLGTGAPFVIEGDEYDTAFFDKGPKFLHYKPHHLIINNIEFDHADIYKNVEAIEEQFQNVARLVPADGAIIANIDDPRVAALIERVKPTCRIVRVSTLGLSKNSDIKVLHTSARERSRGEQEWLVTLQTSKWGELKLISTLSGKHMMANIAQVIGAIESLCVSKKLKCEPSAQDMIRAMGSFKSVARRLEHLGSAGKIDVFEDFAHHPTAVGLVIEGFRAVYPNRRLLVAFEPKNATSRRNIFQQSYVEKLGLADLVYIGPTPDDKKVAAEDRMNTTALAKEIGTKAHSFQSNDDLLKSILKDIKEDDAIIFMSAGSFSGVQHRLLKELGVQVIKS
jgi:UDP-N-acetylmuramate: L-alanyl-gamma-D-glutamyl-meso-diaminopimelate ligase